MNEQELRNEICRVGRSLFERGYVHATAGNISVRLPDGFLITPSDACLGFLDPERLARTDASGVQIGGDRASKTLELHRRIYQADPGAMCVLHTHSTQLVALTLSGIKPGPDLLPPITPYFVMKVGHVPLIAYDYPGAPAVAVQVEQTIENASQRIRAVMLERLGPVVWHETLTHAMATLEELEETARLWNMTYPKPNPLHPEQIENLRRVFKAAW
jgi:ribulose-5-phosphate 4-epimerase/fuculose-1-phosphate aldolase